MTTVTSSPTNPKLPNIHKTPALIQVIQAMFDQFGLLEKSQKKYGDIFYTRKSSLLPPFVIFSDPKAIEKLFTADPNLFEVGEQTSVPIRILLGSNSLVVLNGLEHKRQRQLLMPPFHGERMKKYGQTIIDITENVINQWQVGQSICIRDYTQEISLRVILKAIFGLDEGKQYNELQENLVSLLEIFNSPLKSLFLFLPPLQKDLGFLTPWREFLRQKQTIKDLLNTEINCRKNNPNTFGEDILSLMISARDENGQSMSNEEIQDELMTILFAGHETTANSLAWSMYWIHYIPEIGQKLIAEFNSLNGKTSQKDYNSITKLPYLSAVISETLRLNPVVVFINRQLKQPFELMGYTFEAGTSLLPSIYLTHQRPDIYPQPKVFKPERFLEKQFSPYEYLPFGGGNRRCLGYAFALFEMKLVLATILSQVKLELLDNHPLKSTRRGITFSPAGGVRMKVKALR